MAEESLIKTGEEMGVMFVLKTNGASGVGTPLTAEEISKAVGVIVAADKAVETARFDGKKLILNQSLQVFVNLQINPKHLGWKS